MRVYEPPLAAFRLALPLLGFGERIGGLERFADASGDVVEAILEEAAKIAREVLLPLDRPGDEAGARLEGGRVVLPEGFEEAFRLFAEGGWCGLTIDPEYGGQGLPHVVQLAVMEMVSSACMAFGITPGLAQGAAHALELWGSEAQKRRSLPKLAAGSWTGTMCLTEPQCGTDLGLVRTRAEPLANGRFRIDGRKIFISAGDHGLAANILHLVLARLPDAPAGTRGISLFLVPKFRFEDWERPGEPNGVVCARLEEKMGIHASPTCELLFEDAEGELVGEPHGGMKAMFTMMNQARLGVGIQGLALAEAAYQAARFYAGERLQGRAPKGPVRPDLPADPIVVHPGVRRLLLDIRARTIPARILALRVGMEIDRAKHHPDPAERQKAGDYCALMTPVVKAHFTDIALEATLAAQMVYGGHGYIREHGIEQLVRDAVITRIYEGTNGIQALDLVGRKMAQGTGRLLRRFFHPAAAFLGQARDVPALAPLLPPLAKAFSRLQRASLEIARRGIADPEEGAAAADDYLRLFGITALAFEWGEILATLAQRPELAALDPESSRYPALARHYVEKILPETGALFARIAAGKASLSAEPLPA